MSKEIEQVTITAYRYSLDWVEDKTHTIKASDVWGLVIYFRLNSWHIMVKPKKHFKGDNKGQLSCNPLGKNPSDVWDISNVKHNHPEKTEHPCQFPVELVSRCILSLTNEQDLIYDPYMGSGSTAEACLINNRRYIGSETNEKYVGIANDRIEKLVA